MFNIFKSVAEVFTPVLEESQFYKAGVCTPEEFVEAGDLLISKCPNWKWSSGTSSTTKSYLPAGKQYLYAKGVACFQRATDFKTSDAVTSVIDEQGDEWLVADQANDNNKEDVDTLTKQLANTNINDTNDATATATTTEAATTVPAPAADDDEEFDDLDTFAYDELATMDATPSTTAGTGADTTTTAAPSTASTTTATTTDTNANNSMRRTYDISIVYDKYFRTPRVYLLGYTSTGRVLTPQEMYQDISPDHVHKTVTIETHPYTKSQSLSVHPCRHAHTMLRMIETMVHEEQRALERENELIKAEYTKAMKKREEDAKTFTGVLQDHTSKDLQIPYTPEEIQEKATKAVHTKFPVAKYLLLFLKFIATVVPTIDYDQTASLELF